MDLLLVGCSRFARRRVIPAVASLDAIAALHVASRGAGDEVLAALPKLGRVFRDHEQAIDEVPPGLVYVSLTNDAHARCAERALARGHHVVVDKPAFTDLATAERLVALARARGLVLAEATIYAFHPMLAEALAVFRERGGEPTHLTAAFTPPIPPDDVRFQRARGGGAYLDLGPYAVSIGRLVWGRPPSFLCARTITAAEVPTSFSLLAQYGEGRALVGHFGFTTEYRNWLHLAGPGLSVEAPLIFSTPPEAATDLTVRQRDAISTRRVPPAPAMRLFLEAVLAAIARGDGTGFAAALLEDARVRDALERSAA